ncbi:MAG TPA: hypothetical protein VFR84_16785 [Candidatus Angelobacter sp.]|nr:hypothetical protein [Candidatus Angelobacter sp.]
MVARAKKIKAQGIDRSHGNLFALLLFQHRQLVEVDAHGKIMPDLCEPDGADQLELNRTAAPFAAGEFLVAQQGDLMGQEVLAVDNAVEAAFRDPFASPEKGPLAPHTPGGGFHHKQT